MAGRAKEIIFLGGRGIYKHYQWMNVGVEVIWRPELILVSVNYCFPIFDSLIHASYKVLL